MTWEKLSPYNTTLMVYGLGLFAVIAGGSKFVAPGLWTMYNPDWFLQLIPLTAVTWIYIVGGIEVVAGAAVLSRWNTHIWAGVISVWLLVVTVAVASAGFYDVAFRDLGLALFALATSLAAYR